MATFQSRSLCPPRSEPAGIFRPYNPVKLVYSSRISERQWEEVRPLLECLHREGKTREQMLKSLIQYYEFRPSLYQLNTRMVIWGYKAQRRSSHTDDWEQHLAPSPPTEYHASQGTGRVTRGGDEPMDECCSRICDIDTPMQDSTNQASTFYPSEILKKGMSRVFQSIAATDTAERLCVMFEIVHILYRSDWCSTHLAVLIKHLSQSMGNNDLLLVKEARLLVCREYLQWFAVSKDPQTINWVLQRVEEMIIGSNSVSHVRLVSCLRTCHSLRELLVSPNIDHEIFESEAFVQNLSALQAYLDSHDIENPVLSTYANSLFSGPGMSSLFLTFSINESLARILLSWSIRQINTFEPVSIVNTIDEHTCNDQVLLSFYAGLTKFLITKWIDYSRAVACNSSWSTSDASPAWSDLHLFETIAQTLALLAYFTIELTKKFLLTVPRDLKDDTKFKDKTADLSYRTMGMFKTALRELETTAESNSDYVIHPRAGFIHGIYMEDNVNASSCQLLGHLISAAQESFHLRLAPRSRRHQSALDQLPDQLSAMRGASCLDGLDTMVSRASSTSSVRSFRRGGIKLRDLCGSPSLQSLSSRYSCGSDMHNILEVDYNLQ